jgi:hypothetical protein
MIQSLADIFTNTAAVMGVGVAAILPQILLALILIIAGWIVGIGLSSLIAKGVTALKLDKAFEAAGVSSVIARSGYHFSVGGVLGTLVKWFVILVFVVAALDVLSLDQVNMFLRDVVLSYLPRVIVAVLILIAAALVGDFVYKVVSGTSRAAEVGSHHFLGMIARIAIWAFALLAALNELKVATAFIQTLFTGIVVALSLAVGLSFGLGGRDAAARYIEKTVDEMKKGGS